MIDPSTPFSHGRVPCKKCGQMNDLGECKESVAHFGLTLDSLLTRVILPERDRPIVVKLMQEKLGIRSAQEPIAEHL